MLLQHSRKPVHEKCLPKCLRAEEEVLAPLGDVVMSWGASISMHLLIVQNHWFDSYFEHLLGFTIVFKEAFSPTSGVLGKLGPWRFPQQIEPLENFVWHIGSLENWVAVLIGPLENVGVENLVPDVFTQQIVGVQGFIFLRVKYTNTNCWFQKTQTYIIQGPTTFQWPNLLRTLTSFVPFFGTFAP